MPPKITNFYVHIDDPRFEVVGYEELDETWDGYKLIRIIYAEP